MLKVVICDDDKSILNNVANIVENKIAERQVACDIQAINDARILLEELKKNSIDILFLDIDMPYYSGMDIASYINENMLSTILIFVTIL